MGSVAVENEYALYIERTSLAVLNKRDSRAPHEIHTQRTMSFSLLTGLFHEVNRLKRVLLRVYFLPLLIQNKKNKLWNTSKGYSMGQNGASLFKPMALPYSMKNKPGQGSYRI